jgi:hypothetical protein
VPRPKLHVDYLDSPAQSPEVAVKIFFREGALREKVKAAGGRWSTAEKLWRLPYETAVSLGLDHRIVKR